MRALVKTKAAPGLELLDVPKPSPGPGEVLVKVLDACVFSRYWVFSAATTNVEYTLTVTDTKNGAIKTYHNNQGVSAAAVTDTNAFATCP